MTVIENTGDKQKEENYFPQFHHTVTWEHFGASFSSIFLALSYVSRCGMHKHTGMGKVFEQLSTCLTLQVKLFLACFSF